MSAGRSATGDEPIVDRVAWREAEAILDSLDGLRALVVGDLLLDEYRQGDVERISPEAPVPIVRIRSSRTALGGAGNVARGLAALGARCELVALVGHDAEGDQILSHLAEAGIADRGIVRCPDRPTTHKLRVLARTQQMLRLDREVVEPVASEQGEQLRAALEARIADCDVLVLQDYDKGIFADGLGHFAISLARGRGLPVVADPKSDLARFRGATLVKPNLDEARRFAGVATVAGDEARRALLEKIRHALGGGEVVVTRGREGMSAIDGDGRVFDVPTHVVEVFDVQGAGDTALAALALCRVAGAALREACVVANAAASIAVEKVGTAAVSLAEVRERLVRWRAMATETEEAEEA